MAWKKGESGNPQGGSAFQREKLFRQALMMQLRDAKGELSKLRDIADELIEAATTRVYEHKDKDGKIHCVSNPHFIPAAKEIADRVDGKVPQMVTGDADELAKAEGLTDEQLVARIEDARRLLGLVEEAEGSKELH